LQIKGSRFTPLFSLLLIVGMTACSTGARNATTADSQASEEEDVYSAFADDGLEEDRSTVTDEEVDEVAVVSPEVDAKSRKEIEKEILAANAELMDEAPDTDVEKKTSRPKIPIEINERVQKWIHFFTVTDRERFERFLQRGSVYKEKIQAILKEHDVPRELYYLGMIESGYVTHARSHARAVGPWQFMPGTGRLYGLQQNSYVDERQDILRSTEAAAKYLRGLHTAFQSWYLAMASYNAGPGRIMGAVVRGNSRDYWELVERKALPSETRNYVPKVLAAVIIGRQLDKYGFEQPDGEAFPKVAAAEIAGGVRLTHVASKTGIDLAVLKQLNPHLRRGMTPPNKKTYSIWVPDGKEDQVVAVRAELAKKRVRSRRADRQVASRGYHIVRRGQNLSSIARKYGISVSRLKALNGLRSSRITVGKKLRVSGSVRASTGRVIHRVRKGEALGMISSRYGVPLKRLKRVNGLNSSKIYAGQRLVIRKGI
jgi:membrane-bound lytic murein transglycosylase D